MNDSAPESDSPRRPLAAADDAQRDHAQSDDVQFGDVQFSDARSATRPHADDLPDRNGHYGTAEVRRVQRVQFAPTKVLVDLDAMLDMQEHAAEDTSVELGGILLGHRGVQADGTPFVVISDSLRARHYRATRGSFTFTHATWADLHQQREALPASTEIVGWYHTHPGWSVFLSDMDVFICDHFFPHQDDIALVIDPSSGDTGLFVRRQVPSHRAPGRLDHFYLYAHRRRHAELAGWASYFSGAETMSQPAAAFPGRQASPLVVTSGGGPEMVGVRYLPLLVIGLLSSQLLLTAILLGLLIFNATSGVNSSGSLNSTAGANSPAGAQQTDQSAAISSAQTLSVREAIVDELLGKIVTQSPAELEQSFRQLATDNASLKASQLGLMNRVEQLDGELSEKQSQLTRATDRLAAAESQLTTVESQLAAQRAAQKKAVDIADETAEGESADDENRIARRQLFGLDWLPLLIGVLVGGVVAGSAVGLPLWQRLRAVEGDVA
ncbi:Mov34/MPN/PAD-1 family protein [Planctomycetaceae bacterium SH139]